MSVLTGMGELFGDDGVSRGKGEYRLEVTERTTLKLGRIEGTIDLDQTKVDGINYREPPAGVAP